MTIVTFNADVSPYMTGDTVDITDQERKRVDEEAARRGLKDAYSSRGKPTAKKAAKAPAKKRKTK